MSAAPLDPSGRFQMRSRGELQLPGSCMICGSGTCDEGYLDFGIFVDYHGTLYFCVTCLKEAAQVIGCETPEDANLFRENTEEKLNLLVKVQKELSDAREYITDLRRVLSSQLHTGDSLTGDAEEEQQRVSEPNDESAPSPVVGEPKSKKPIKGPKSPRLDGLK